MLFRSGRCSRAARGSATSEGAGGERMGRGSGGGFGGEWVGGDDDLLIKVADREGICFPYLFQLMVFLLCEALSGCPLVSCRLYFFGRTQ